MEAPELNLVNTMFETSQNPYENWINPKRPPDTAVNIQWGRMPLRNNFNTPRSPSALTMDSSPPSEMDYAKRVATLNNRMDVEMSNSSVDYTRNIVLQQTHGDNCWYGLTQPYILTAPLYPSSSLSSFQILQKHLNNYPKHGEDVYIYSDCLFITPQPSTLYCDIWGMIFST